MTHCTTATGAFSWVSIDGSATLTTDSSMKAVDDPRMPAIKVQVLWESAKPVTWLVERIVPSAQGLALGLIMLVQVNHETERRPTPGIPNGSPYVHRKSLNL